MIKCEHHFPNNEDNERMILHYVAGLWLFDMFSFSSYYSSLVFYSTRRSGATFLLLYI